MVNECSEVFLGDRPCQYKMNLHKSLMMEAEIASVTTEMHSILTHVINLEDVTAQGLQVQTFLTAWMFLFFCTILRKRMSQNT